jgi:hypothetical protein
MPRGIDAAQQRRAVAGRDQRTVLGLLLRLRQALCGWGGRLTLRHLHPRLYEVFEVTKLHTLFDIRGAGGGPGSGAAVAPRG